MAVGALDINRPAKVFDPANRAALEADGTGAAGAVAFQAFLNVTQQRVQVSGEGAGPVSPEQMFEAPVQDLGSQSRNSLREQYQSKFGEDDGSLGNETDRMPVESPNTGSPAVNAFKDRNAIGRGDFRQDDLSAGRNESLPGGGSSALAAAKPSPATSVKMPSTDASTRMSTSNGTPHPSTYEPTEKRLTSSSTTASLSPMGQAATSNASSSPAERVAEMLIAPRSVRVESPQAATSTGSSATLKSPSGDSHTTKADEQQAATRDAETTPSEASESPSFDRLLRSLRVRSGSKSSSARVRLQPPELGNMIVNLKMERNGLRIDVRTESDAARALVQERSDELKTALQQHGLHVERFEVTADLPPEVRTGNGSRRDALAARDADTKRRRESNRIQGMEQRPSDPRLGETPEIGRWNRRLDIRV